MIRRKKHKNAENLQQLPDDPPQPQPNGVPIELPSPPKKQSKLKWLFIVAAVLLGLIGVASISAMIWYSVELAPRSVADIYHVVEVKPGESSSQIADSLEEQGIINSSTAFLLFTKINRIHNLQAGTYRLSSGQTSAQIARTLEKGEVGTINVLILPGQRLSQIKQKLMNAGYSKADIENGLAAVRSHPLLKGYPKNEPIEGYLFPDTYNIAPSTSATELMKLMLDNFESKITPSIKTGLKKQGLSVAQGIILASIVQKEVAKPADQKIVAQVFLKRLNEGSVLGSDVTFQYAAAETGQPATPELDSPYNTRKVAGLPPTAIANFDISALESTANPAKTDYHYFVAGDDGKIYYSRTEEEHNANVQAHCASCFQ